LGSQQSGSLRRLPLFPVPADLTTGEQGRVTGIMLASESFDTLPEAVQHVEATFGGAA